MTPDSLRGRGRQPKRLLAASAPSLGALLNVRSGLGSGSIHQRRLRVAASSRRGAVRGAVPQAVLTTLLALILPPPAPAAALTAAAALPSKPAAPPLQTFQPAAARLSGCLGLVRPRPRRPQDGPGDPLLLAWSLNGGWGVMRLGGRLERFALQPARRSPASGATSTAAFPSSSSETGPWLLEWRVGRLDATLRFGAERLSPRRWGGDGRLWLRSLATGDSYVLPVRVEGGCGAAG